MSTPQAADLVAAALAAGVSPAEMSQALTAALTRAATAAAAPTLAEYLPVVRAITSATTWKAWGVYLERLADRYGQRRLDTLTTSELIAFAADMRAAAVTRATSTGGRGAHRNAVGALRKFFATAVADGLITRNPALGVPMPAKSIPTRRGLTNAELDELYAAVTARSADPRLHLLIMQTHLLTGARSAEVRRIQLADLDPDRGRIRLWGKNDTVIWQPVAPDFVTDLAAFAAARGASAGEDAVLRSLSGAGLQLRTYERLHHHWRTACGWARTEMVSAHWLRHTVGTRVERRFGHAIAARFLRHRNGDTTSGYTTASLADLADVAAWLSGAPHPLQQRD